MELIKKIVDLILITFFYQKGKDAAEKKAAEDELEAIDNKNRVHDRVDSDPEYRAGVQDRFRR